MKMTCDTCSNHLGGGCCRLNEETECREGGGYELYEPRKDERINKDDHCVVCDKQMPDGYGMVCKTCLQNNGVTDTNAPFTTYLHNLLEMERISHKKTNAQFNKAEHDKRRYARRIRLLQGEVNTLRQENKQLHEVLNEMIDLTNNVLYQEIPYDLYSRLIDTLTSYTESEVSQNGV